MWAGFRFCVALMMLWPMVCAAADAPATQPNRPLRVGIILSKLTATQQFQDKPRGYEKQLRIVPDLKSPDIELYPILEPETAQEPGVPELLKQHFPNREPIDGADAEALKKLDAIAMGEIWDANETMLTAMEAAVRSGVGFLNCGGIGINGMQIDSPAAHLTGLTNPGFGSTNQAIPCQVMTPHPILGDLLNRDGLMLRPMGVYGTLPAGAEALIGVTDPKQVRGNNDSADFYPLYISSLDKGRIIGVQFAPYKAVDPALQEQERAKFFVRCVRWLGKRLGE